MASKITIAGDRRAQAAALMGLLLASARCGETQHGETRGPSDAGAGGEGTTASGGEQNPAGQGAGGAPVAAGGGGAIGVAGGADAGAGGVPQLFDCEPADVKLRAVVYSGEDGETARHVLVYDAVGRVKRVEVSGGHGEHAELPPGDYLYHHDDQDRVDEVSVDSSCDDCGFYVVHGSGSTRYVWDVEGLRSLELSDRRWLEFDHYRAGDPPSHAYSLVPTWEAGLISQILRASGSGQTTTLRTFQYDVDGEGRPLRMVEVGQPAPPTEEIYDEAGRHLFQLVRPAGDEHFTVGLYRDNANPVRSLMAAVEPSELLASNVWLWASSDPAGDAGVVGPRPPKPPDLMPWGPLSLTESESVDFATDLDGNDEEDVRGDYEFDDQGRLTSFALELNQAPSVTVTMTYTPGLVTETIDYLDAPSEVRRYHYGCDTTDGAGGESAQ